MGLLEQMHNESASSHPDNLKNKEAPFNARHVKFAESLVSFAADSFNKSDPDTPLKLILQVRFFIILRLPLFIYWAFFFLYEYIILFLLLLLFFYCLFLYYFHFFCEVYYFKAILDVVYGGVEGVDEEEFVGGLEEMLEILG